MFINKTILHWSYRNFKHVPLELLYYDDNLEEIYLKENFITKIPSWLCQLKHLKFIHFSGNCIDEIPDDIYLLENLEFFDISNNCLESIPNSIGNMRKLQRLNLSGNKINIIPNSIGNLKQLELLDISENPITRLPMEICECNHLIEFILNGLENLLYVSERIVNMRAIQLFSADRCGLLYLPAPLSKFVTHVRVFNNTNITYIPIVYEKYFSTFYQSVTTRARTWDNSYNLFLIKELETNTTHLLPFGTRMVFKTEIGEDCKITLYDHALNSLNNLNLIYPIYKCSEILDNLPSVGMKNHIKIGPISKCNICSKFLYTTYYLEILKRRRSTSKSIFICNFCSIYCANYWWKDNRRKFRKLEWEIYEAS